MSIRRFRTSNIFTIIIEFYNDISQLSNGLDYLGDYVKKNIAGNYVTLTTEKYEFPCDGYVVVSSELSESGIIRVVIEDKNNTNVAYLYMNITGMWQVQSTFVRKGLIGSISSTTLDTPIVGFIPLT